VTDVWISSPGGSCSDAEHRLFSVIFSSYNQHIRPVENVTDPVVVQFEVSMSQLVKVVRADVCSSRDLRITRPLMASRGADPRGGRCSVRRWGRCCCLWGPDKMGDVSCLRTPLTPSLHHFPWSPLGVAGGSPDIVDMQANVDDVMVNIYVCVNWFEKQRHRNVEMERERGWKHYRIRVPCLSYNATLSLLVLGCKPDLNRSSLSLSIAQVSNTRPAGQIRPAALFDVAPDGLKDTWSPFLKEIEEKIPVLLFWRFQIKWIYVGILETFSYVQYVNTQINKNQMQRVLFNPPVALGSIWPDSMFHPPVTFKFTNIFYPLGSIWRKQLKPPENYLN